MSLHVELPRIPAPLLFDEDVEVFAHIHLEHTNGIQSSVILDWTSKKSVREVRFHTKTGHRWTSQLYDGTDRMFERETKAFLDRVKDGTAPPNGPTEATETLRWCLEARDMVRKALEVRA